MALKFISDLAQVGDRPEIETASGGEFVRALPKALSSEDVKSAIRAAMHEITDYLNSLETGNGPFQLDEAELTLQVDQSGKVNLVLGDVGGKISGGLRLKWKRSKL